MCMVNVKINEAELRELRPELNNMAAITLWVQNLVNLQMQQMRTEDEDTISVEELRAMLHETVRKVYVEP